MKKILTFAIMALLMGGLTFNATAQDRTAQGQEKVKTEKTKVAKKTKETKTVNAGKDTKEVKTSKAVKTSKETKSSNEVAPKTTAPKTVAKTDWNKTLTEYEQAVDKCVKSFQDLQKPKKDASGKDVTKIFNEALEKAENLKAKINKAKGELDRTQADRFDKANTKLQQVYVKG